MYIQRVDLRNFRNFVDGTVEFPEGGAALIGDNGQGKTNLLEAIYYLEIFRSFRGARDEHLITFGRDHFRLEGRLVGHGADEEDAVVGVGYARAGRRKKVTVDGGEPDRVGEAIGKVGAIIFTAGDVEIVAGSPGARRRFLDIILSLVEPGYLMALQRYRQVLGQRNGLLRDGAGSPELAAWDEGLVEAGSRLCQARARWVEARCDSFAAYYSAISGGGTARLRYRPSVGRAGLDRPASREGWAAVFEQALGQVAERERRRGVTLVGPHRDDLRFVSGDESGAVGLRGFGSAGQQRTAAIALRLVEAGTRRAARGMRPVVMLDDVFAELDPQRAERVVELVGSEDWGQVLVTSPKPSDAAMLGGRLAEYRVADGRVRRP